MGDEWTWSGDLLNIHRCDRIKAVFRLEEIKEFNGEECAVITGKVIDWPDGYSPSVALKTWFSLSRKVPVFAKHEYASAARKQSIEVSLLEYIRSENAENATSPAPAPTLDDLSWMAGHWSKTQDQQTSARDRQTSAKDGQTSAKDGQTLAEDGQTSAEDGQTFEEYWMPPRGGLMLGLHRNIIEKGDTFFEYLRIEETPEGILYQASPQGRSPTPFKLTKSGDRSALFENPEHDFPQRIRYWIDEAGVLHARIEGTIDGSEKSSEWTYSKAAVD